MNEDAPKEISASPRWYRFFEILPAILAWSTLVAIVVCSWRFPRGTAIFIILFDTYWFLKTVYFSMHLRASFKKMRQNLTINWLQNIRALPGHQWSEVWHLIVLPMYKEPYELVKETMRSLLASNYPKDRFIVVLATEGRAPDGLETAKRIEKEFGGKFFKFLVTVHPPGLPEEIPGKGSNEAWAAQEAKRLIIDPLGIPYESILVSVFDVDTQVFPDYFGILTYEFLTCPFPQRSSFQPVPLFINNIYQAPALARVIAFSSTFWHLIQQSRPERLTTFSSHSMPFKPLVEVGFWNRNVVSEDSQIFWQCYIHYDGDWRVVPIHYPVAMDANATPSFWQTMKNLYLQQRRWAWGCENIPYFLEGFRRNKRIPFKKRLYRAFHYIEGFHSWSTNSIVIFSLGWLPVIIGGGAFNVSVLSYNLPRVTRGILSFSMIGIISSVVLSMTLLPPKPEWFRKKHYFYYAIQWLLMPFTLIIFGSFAALDAQTRLAIGGRYRLGFWVTPKYR